MKIEIDHDSCMGVGQCVLAAPDVFDQYEDGRSLLLIQEPDAVHHRAVRDARDVCPLGAITLQEG